MNALIYYISLPFIYAVSYLPFRVLYLLSDFLNFIVFTIIGYRKEVVFNNLKKSFPNKSALEIKAIHKEFNSFFCDWVLEMIKAITISREESIKRCHFTNTTILEKMAKQNKQLIFVMGHMGNFEFGGPEVEKNTAYKLNVVYKPLSNPYFDALIKKKRTRYHTGVISMKSVYKELLKGKESENLTATAFISDQTPPKNNAYWTTFLNQDTPVFWGTENISKKLNYPIIYISIKRVKRGFYEMTPELLFENPKDTKMGEISEMHTNRLEQDIIKQPEIWLWSHRRWKHTRPSEKSIDFLL